MLTTILLILVATVPIMAIGIVASKTITKLEDDLVLIKKNNESLMRQYNALASKYNTLLSDYKAVYIKLQKLQK